MGSEIKVGVIFFLGMIILFVMTVIVTGISFFQGGYSFDIYFENISGLEKGGRVLFSGVNIGTVDNITFTKEGIVRVNIRVEDETVFIPADSEVTIEQASLLAGMQVAIANGISKQHMKDAEFIKGEEPAEFTKAISNAATAAEKAIDDIREPLKNTIENIEGITKEIKEGDGTAHKLIYEEEIYEDVRVAADKLRNILAEIDAGKGTVGKLVKDETVYEKLASTLEEAEKAVKGIREIVESAQKGEGTLGKLIKDEEVYDNVRDITRDLKEATSKLNKGKGILAKLFSDESEELYTDIKDTASGASELFKRLNNGEGTLGKLFTSDEVYDDVKEITGNLSKATKQLTTTDNTLGKLLNESGLYDKAETTLDNLDVTLGAAARMQVFVHADYFHSNHPYQESRSRIQLKIWPHERRYFLIGGTFMSVGDASPLIVTDPVKEQRKQYLVYADAQLAWVLDLGPSATKRENRYLLTARVGMLEGLLGGGFDIDFWRHFRITCEGRDYHADDRKRDELIYPFYARAYLSMKVLDYFRIYAGADNVVDKAVISFGVSIEWEDKDIKNIVGIAGSAF